MKIVDIIREEWAMYKKFASWLMSLFKGGSSTNEAKCSLNFNYFYDNLFSHFVGWCQDVHAVVGRQIPRVSSLLPPCGFWPIILRSSGLMKHLYPMSHLSGLVVKFLFSSAVSNIDSKIQVPVDICLSMYSLNKCKILALFYAKYC